MAGNLPLTQYDKWKDGDFEVVSSDNVKFCVPTYLLQAASGVFRRMIEADSSAKRIVLPERADAIRPALDTMAAGYFDYSEWGPTWREDEVVSVVKFFQKYDCRTGLNQVEQFVRTRWEGFDEVLPRLIAAIYLKRDDLCADLIEQYPNDFTFLNLGRDNSSLPFEQFTLIPIRSHPVLLRNREGEPEQHLF